YTHQDLPFEQLVHHLAPQRDLSRNPLFHILFSYDNSPKSELALPGVATETVPLASSSPMVDLSFELTEAADGSVTGVVTYATALFQHATIARLTQHYLHLLDQVAHAPDTPLNQLALVSEDEIRAVLAAGDGAEVPRPPFCLHELIAQQAGRTPNADALLGNGQTLSYRELNDRADRFARHLRRRGAGPGQVVALYLERSADLVVSLLAVLKTGAAYLPLDPVHPESRLHSMVTRAGAGMLITQKSLAARAGALELPAVVCDSDEVIARIAREPTGDLGVPVHEDDPAYVIFTSGSTGLPKGIQIPHRGIRNHVLWAVDRHGVTAEDRVLHKTSTAFDAAAWEIMAPLVAGGTVVLAPVGAELDMTAMAAAVAEHQVTVIQFVPSVLRLFLDAAPDDACRSLRLVTCAGEPLPLEACVRLRRRWQVQVTNTYGPTECSIDVTSWSYRDGTPGISAPLGHPLHNTRVRILDAHGLPVPRGIPGEIHLGGESLAHGYVGRPRLTADRFVPDPFTDRPGARLYRTGDLARWQEDGTIEYLGRTDDQVKIGGVRIEPGEVEAALQRHPAVDSAAIVIRPVRGGEPSLVAFVTGDRDRCGDLRSHLRTQLPRAMVPSAVLFVDRLPLLPNGKLDRRTLLSLEGTPDALPDATAAPRNALERSIARVWSQVLATERVGIHDGFFSLGGNSLAATRAAFLLTGELDRDVPTRLLFEADTVARLALALDPGKPAGPESDVPRRPGGNGSRLSFGQERLWLIDQLHDNGTEYLLPTAWR
ncbi:amino acid adenylation domain-containing protein, partial [Streptomyces tsukubensis]|uniref:non-ribosomal peptide synthetase n=1 Tax=Streptomyces tsukubensis TaxID=83656 RepID=UPI0036A7B92F